jgi:filamentous hemagglutinin family protein
MRSRLPLRTALLLGTALTLPSVALAQAPLPQGGRFTAGAGSITGHEAQLTLRQSTARGVVDWRSFSVGSGRTVRIENGTGATLNRVTGDAPSTIAGTVSATGSVYLVNPQGIVVAAGGRIATGGSFIGTTRPVDAARFMESGQIVMRGTGDGTVENKGRIEAGEDVVLVGRSVTNSGAVRAQGNAAAVSGDEVVLQREGDRSRVMVRGGVGGEVRNTGTIEAAEVALRAAGGNVYALAGNAGSYIRATGTTTRNGRVILAGQDEVQVEGSVSAEGATGGSVTIRAGSRARVAGSVSARGSAGDGGRVTIAADSIEVASGARIDVSGAGRGGTVLIGGDRAGGRDPAQRLSARPMRNATLTEVAPGASIMADGAADTGGNIVVWSEQETRFAGQLSARGFTAGGFAEVSSHGLLGFAGSVDLRGATGRNGTLLLDPADIYITEASAPAGSSTLSATLVGSLLATTNVTVQTGAGAGNGDIVVQAPITWSGDHALALSANRHVIINAPIQAMGGGDLTLQADHAGTGIGTVSFGASGAARLNGGHATILYNAANFALPTDYRGFVTGSRSLDALMLVTSQTQMAAIDTNPSGTYALGRDLDWTGRSFAPLAAFSGVFDGRGHRLSGITIDTVGKNDVGIWQELLPGSHIRNLNITDAHVTALQEGSPQIGGARVGILAGTNGGEISNSTIAGQVSGDRQVGGVAGRNTGIIHDVATTATVNAAVRPVVFAILVKSAGGIVGINAAAGSITNAAFAGSVTGARTGGIAGENFGAIDSVVSTGRIVLGQGGGLVGQNSFTGQFGLLNLLGSVTNGYWDTQISGVTTSSGPGTGLTTAQLAAAALPPGLSSTAWRGGDGRAPHLLNLPTEVPAWSLAGTASAIGGQALPLAMIGVLTSDGLVASPAGADGHWSQTVPVPLQRPGDVLVALLSGAAPATVQLAGVSTSAQGVALQSGTARIVMATAQDTAVSSLLAARDGLLNGSTVAELMPLSGAPPLTGTLDITVPASLRLDAVLATDGIIALRAEGVTQSAPLSAAALALQGAGRFSLNHPDNSFGTVAGAVGSADLVTTGGLSIGSAGGMTGLTASGEVRLAAGGDVTQSAALSAAALALQGPGRFSLTHPDNSLGTVAGAVGSADLVTIGGLSIGSAGGFNGLASEADIRIRIGGELSLRAALSGRGSGDVLVLNAARLTDYTSGGLSIEGGGRWLVYLPDIGTVTASGLSARPYYGLGFGELPPAAGNRFVYRAPRVLSVNPDTVTTIYDGTVPQVGAGIAGLVDGDTLADAVSGSAVVAGAKGSAGQYMLAAERGSLTSDLGYKFAFGSSNLTVEPRPLTWSVSGVTLPYGAAPNPGTVTLGGAVAGDQVGALVALASEGTGEVATARPAPGRYTQTAVALAGPGAGNYALARTGNQVGILTVLPPPIAPITPPITVAQPPVAAAAISPAAPAAALAQAGPVSAVAPIPDNVPAPPVVSPAPQPRVPAPSSVPAAATTSDAPPTAIAPAPAPAADEAAAPPPVTTAAPQVEAVAEASPLAVLAAPSGVSSEARTQFSARANEVLARGGSPAAAASAAAAALAQTNAATVAASAAGSVAQVATSEGAGALAAALARGMPADQALAQEAARAATLAAMQAASAVPSSEAALMAGALAQSGAVAGPGAATLAALLASGVDPERAAALAARAAAEQAAMLQASSVPASAEEARATDIARGSSAGASADLATALARGASPAAAAAVAAIAEAERAAALEASTVAIADPQFAALVGGAVDGATVTVTRRGQPLTVRPEGRPDGRPEGRPEGRRDEGLSAQPAQEPSSVDEVATAFATGRLSAAFLARLPDSAQADRMLAVLLRRGVPLQQILADALPSTAGNASDIASAQVPGDELVNRLGGADIPDDYLVTLNSGTAPDRFLRTLGLLLHRGATPAEALQRARGGKS